MRSPANWAWAAYATVCLVWGSTFLGIRIADETIPPILMIGVRSVLAGGIMLGVARALGARWPGWRGIVAGAASGALLFCGGQALLAWGEVRVASGQAAVLNATLALFLPFCAWALGTARFPRPVALAGLLLGFAGVAVLARPGAPPQAAHGGAAPGWAGGGFWRGRAMTRKYPPSRYVAITAGLQMLFGGLTDFAAAWPAGEYAHFDPGSITARSIYAFFYLVVMGSLVAFAAFSWLVHIWPPDRLATYTFVNPVVALALGAAVGEAVGVREIGAVALILAAVALVMREKKIGGRGRLPTASLPARCE